MACQRFAGQLRDVAAGGEPAPGLVAHLEQCASCREALAQQRALLASIEANFAREVRVEPSADFEARVRARIASEPVAPAWFGGWRLVAAAASVALVAIALAGAALWWGGAGERPGTTAGARTPNVGDRAAVEPAPQAPTVHEEKRPGPDTVAVAASPRAAKAGIVYSRRVRPTSSREPEVLVALDQQMAIARTLNILRDAKLDEQSQMREPSEPAVPGAPALVVQELTVPPIVIDPGNPEKQW